MRGPQYRPQNTIVLIMRTPKWVSLILGNPHITPTRVTRCWSQFGTSPKARQFLIEAIAWDHCHACYRCTPCYPSSGPSGSRNAVCTTSESANHIKPYNPELRERGRCRLRIPIGNQRVPAGTQGLGPKLCRDLMWIPGVLIKGSNGG